MSLLLILNSHYTAIWDEKEYSGYSEGVFQIQSKESLECNETNVHTRRGSDFSLKTILQSLDFLLAVAGDRDLQTSHNHR